MATKAPEQRIPSSTVDLTVDGIQHGHLTVPVSTHQSRLGAAQVPVCVMRNGEGPTVSLISGTGGDEFEGQIALHNLASSIALESISGCLILVPGLNPLALANSSAASPSDAKTLSHCFPGNENGTDTQRLAAMLYRTLLQPADLVIELRSGGYTTEYAPMASVHFNHDKKDLQARCEETMIAFGAPYSTRLALDNTDTLAISLYEQNSAYMCAWLGGGGVATASRIEIATTGCRNALVQCGVLQHELVLRSTRMLEVTSNKNYVIAPDAGLLEMCRDTGDEVYMGSPVARIIQPGHTGSKPIVLKADRNGILMARHCHGLINQGDCIAVVADEVQR